jgi:hypothetical protein
MKASQLTAQLEQILLPEPKDGEERLALMIWGPPGIGKSQIVKQFALANGYRFIDVRLSQMGPEDLQGCPFIVEEDSHKKTAWGTPLIWPTENDPKTLLFFDEITHAPHSTLKSAFQIVLDKQIGQFKFPKNTIMAAAGNRPEDRSGALDLPEALKGRFIHTLLEPDVADFASWWVRNEKDPRILAYIRATKKLETLHCMPNGVTSDPASPSPRTWAFASQVLDLVSPTLRLETLKGTIGPGEATALCAHLEMELPDVDMLLQQPWKFTRPRQQGVIYALVGAFVNAVEADTLDAFMEIADKMTKEAAMLMTRDLYEHKKHLAISSPKFNKWCVENKYLVL